MKSSKELADALSRVHQIAKKYGGNIAPSREIERVDRELLLRTQWLQEIIRGWYMLVRPDIQPGDTSAWYANFWNFVQVYLQENYSDSYCLSAENSIDLHIGTPTIPKQVIVLLGKEGGTTVKLPFDTSLLVYSDPKNFPPERVKVNGLQVMSLPYALCKATPTYFQKKKLDAQIALGLIKDLQELSYIITTYNLVRAGERIIGAFKALNAPEKAQDISDHLKKMGLNLTPINPFEQTPVIETTPFHSPYQGRIFSLWNSMRQIVIDNFPTSPGLSKNAADYLHKLEELYKKDAYNSLSIEGYQVNADLIECVLNNNWNPDLYPSDFHEKNALAARGYYEAFLEVKNSILQILRGEKPGKVIKAQLQHWFQKLFAPNVSAGLLQDRELLGYRKHQVYIRNSRHVPFPREVLFEAMEAFFDCLQNEEHPAASAILGHFIFVYIHPYMDGNGRLARFLMNTLLASGGYPWTIIEVNNRARYFAALEKAAVDQDILPFTLFVKEEMKNRA
jgi:hypothetical protein